MNTTLLRQALLTGSVSQLEQLIDVLDRPWAPGRNDALRAAWHEARRSDGARRALVYTVEEELRSLQPGRDVTHVAGRLELSVHSPEAICAEVIRRFGGVAFPLPITPALIASALTATAEIARLVLGTPRHGRDHHSRGRRHGR